MGAHIAFGVLRMTDQVRQRYSGRLEAVFGLSVDGASLVASFVPRGIEGRALAATGPVADALSAGRGAPLTSLGVAAV